MPLAWCVLQNLGIDENALDVYDEGLRKGKTLITIPCARASARDIAYLLHLMVATR
jgi:hypothetical protein